MQRQEGAAVARTSERARTSAVEIVAGFPEEEMFELGSEALCLTSRHGSLVVGRNVGHGKEKEHAAGCIR